jgi:hypothetical protein
MSRAHRTLIDFFDPLLGFVKPVLTQTANKSQK